MLGLVEGCAQVGLWRPVLELVTLGCTLVEFSPAEEGRLLELAERAARALEDYRAGMEAAGLVRL